MDIILKKACEEDFSEIALLFREFAGFERQSEKMINNAERMLQEKEYFNCYVAVTSTNKIIGYATYFYAYFTWLGKSMYMDDLYVQPAFRGQGIGTRLINQIVQTARDNKCHKVRWQVSHWNQPAIDFYKSLGAVVTDGEHNCDLMLD